jgi:hypothetical protein
VRIIMIIILLRHDDIGKISSKFKDIWRLTTGTWCYDDNIIVLYKYIILYIITDHTRLQ